MSNFTLIKCVQNVFFGAGMFRRRSSCWYCEIMFVNFIPHSTFYNSRTVIGFHIFPSPCLCLSCVATVSHTFLLYERPERATKWLNTLKYSERLRRSVGVRRSTWRDLKAVGSHSVGWNYFVFCEQEDKKKETSNGWVCKKYKRIKCWCFSF